MKRDLSIHIPVIPFLFLNIFIIIVLLSGCTHQVPSPVVNVTPPDSCSIDINYVDDIRVIVTENCALAGCHVPAGFKDFTSYVALVDVIETSGKEYFLTRISEGGGMPPDYTTGPSQLTMCDMDKFRAWLDSDYPEQ